jgi:hypothetical protein
MLPLSSTLFRELIKGLFLACLYVFVTKDDDTTLSNILKYTTYFFILILSFLSVGFNADIIASAFISKTIFIIIDERIKSSNPKNKDILQTT